jgi:hypothetical protein
VDNSSAAVLSFTEESCWTKDEQYRARRIPVAFTLQSVGKRMGAKIRLEFTEDYGVFYQSGDEEIIARLSALEPGVEWGYYVYYRQHSKARIDVLDPDTDKVAATITTRRYLGRPVDAEAADRGDHGANVSSFAGIRGRLDVLAARAAEREAEKRERHAALRAAGVITDER